MSTPNYVQIIGFSAFIVSPILLCFCFPAQKYIVRFQKELLASSLGTIAGFLFFEIIPEIIKEGQQFIKKEHGHTHVDRFQLFLLSNTIFIGMLFAGILGILHNFLEHNEHEQPINKKKEEEISRKNCLSWIPGTCKIIWIGTSMHNLADGMIIGLTPRWTIAWTLFIHEITHTLCNVTFYITLGMTKWQAIILRAGSCIFVFFGSLGAQTQFIRTYHLYGHALVLGIFFYMMLVDVLPILIGSHVHDHCVAHSTKSEMNGSAKETNEGNGVDKESKVDVHSHDHHKNWNNMMQKLILFMIFVLSFAVVAMSIVLSGDTHDCSDHKHKCGHHSDEHHHHH